MRKNSLKIILDGRFKIMPHKHFVLSTMDNAFSRVALWNDAKEIINNIKKKTLLKLE